MGITLASVPTGVWAHLLSGESSCNDGGGLEHPYQQLHSLSSLDDFHAFHQCQSRLSNPPAASNPFWELHDMDYSFRRHYMMDPPPAPNSFELFPPGPIFYGQEWNGASSLFNQLEHEQQQQHCLDYPEPSLSHILPNSDVNLLHESPEEEREAKRSATAVAASNQLVDCPREEISSCSSSDSNKRPRLDQAAACVPLKGQPVRKEKLWERERITALQQLVSPFGKTDTSSVLQEAIGYIKFLQDQVQVLSTPYMKPTVNLGNMNSLNSQAGLQELGSIPNRPSANPVERTDHVRQDLRSRGLCLVPVSCALPVANDNGADFWTPPINGGCR